MANKHQRVASLIQKNISDIILFEMKSPLMKLVSVNYCTVTNDYSYAKIYVSHLKESETDKVVEVLNKSKGLIRSLLSKKMDIYKVPELQFYKDDTYEKGQRIEAIIADINKK